MADEIGYPVVMKIVSPDILHKTEAGGVVVGVSSAAAAEAAYQKIVDAASRHAPDAKIEGVQVQQMLTGEAQEVIVGAVTDPSFGKLVAFGLGGVLVEVLKDVTFRLAPASAEDALSMLDGIQAAEVLRGVRGADPVDRDALARVVVAVSNLVADFPEIQEVDLNPIFATKDGATAVDALISVDFAPKTAIFRPSQEEILGAMNRIFHPRCRGRDRRVGGGRQDRQLGDEEPDQRRLSGRHLPGPPQGRRDPRQEGLQERPGHPGRGRPRGLRASRPSSAPPPWTRSAGRGSPAPS